MRARSGHPLSAVNSYGFGRLAWSPATPSSTISREWAGATFGLDAAGGIAELLEASWPAYENYTSTLGWGFVCAADHYHMVRLRHCSPPAGTLIRRAPQDPAHRNAQYINASQTHIGFARPRYAATYGGAVGTNLPEELLLAFANVPYSRRLRGAQFGGLTVLEWIVAAHDAGARTAQAFTAQWEALRETANVTATGMSFDGIAALLAAGAHEAATFNRTVVDFVLAMASPSAPAGFIRHASSFCSTSAGGRRIYDARQPLADCAATCSTNSSCACLDWHPRLGQCRWVDAGYVLRPSSDAVSFIKSIRI